MKYDNELLINQRINDKNTVSFFIEEDENCLNRSIVINNITLNSVNISDDELIRIMVAVDVLFANYIDIHKVVFANHEDSQSECTKQQLLTCIKSNNNKQLWLVNGAVLRSGFYQSDVLCLNKPLSVTSPSIVYFNGVHQHPIRVKKQVGVVYQRYIPWLSATLSFEVFNKEKHMQDFHCWMNDPVVDEFWEESGSIEKHTKYIDQKLAEDSHTLALVSYFDDEAFGYFEVYWAKEDRISAYYHADDFDRGWHVLIGNKNYRGKQFISAWMPSISHYMFLDDCRTQRIVIEPRIDNEKMKRSLGKCGYAHYKTFDFPHKRAMLGMLQREHFFSDHCLIPVAS